MAEQWVPQLNIGYDQPYIIQKFQQKQTPEEVAAQDFKEMKQGAAKSAQAAGAAGGGFGGMLTSGGMSAGIASLGAAPGSALAKAAPIGWGVMGGGLFLSAIEKNKQEKAAREQAQIDAEMQKRQNLIALARDAANTDFRIA